MNRSEPRAHRFPRVSGTGLLLGLALGLSVAAPARASVAPQINSLSVTTLARSGRLLIFGQGFGVGGSGSQLLIDGLPAIATTWLPTEIHAYVPEAATLGPVSVQAVTPGGSSNVLSLEVTLRAPDGRILWRFQTDGGSNRQFIGRAPDGTLYTSDYSGTYALSPEGALLWVSFDAWGGKPISVAVDGTLYSGRGDAQSANPAVVALHPDGSLKWVFQPPPLGGLNAGPNVAPDGKIWAVQEAFTFGGLGLFVLDADGNLLASDQGSPKFFSDPGDNSEIVFGPNRVYSAMKTDGGGLPLLWAHDTNANQQWTTAQLPGGSHPVLDPFDRVLFKWGDKGISALSPDGAQEWISTHPNGTFNVHVVSPTGDSAGRVYSGDWLGVELWAMNPDGTTRWVQPNSGEELLQLAAAPGDEILVATGSLGFGQPGWVRGYATADGALLWQLDLPDENGLHLRVDSGRTRFTPDGATAYVTSHALGGTNDHGYVYAIAIDAQIGVWTDLAHGLAGTHGVPALTGDGTLLADTPVSLSLDLARENTAAFLIIGTQAINLPFRGGTLVPDFSPPDGRILPLFTDGSGRIALNATWPAGLAAGLTLYYQYWIDDPAGPFGMAASNAILGIAP